MNKYCSKVCDIHVGIIGGKAGGERICSAGKKLNHSYVNSYKKTQKSY